MLKTLLTYLIIFIIILNVINFVAPTPFAIFSLLLRLMTGIDLYFVILFKNK